MYIISDTFLALKHVLYWKVQMYFLTKCKVYYKFVRDSLMTVALIKRGSVEEFIFQFLLPEMR